ncbi:MAG TPA: cytochrome c maturation protein CcmE [Alphaproteobacteria bacterium]|nr:cytochrome c maturation protein CcmE [Alphaproteobacteria bacterium]
MTRKRRRLLALTAGLLALGSAAALALSALDESLVFFQSPSDIEAKTPPTGRIFRLGGLVEEGSLQTGADGTVRFRVTDLKEAVSVTFKGVLPDLFREGQGVVAQGRLQSDGVFVATEILAKHDETYMPAEVAEALKKSGRWREGEEAGP